MSRRPRHSLLRTGGAFAGVLLAAAVTACGSGAQGTHSSDTGGSGAQATHSSGGSGASTTAASAGAGLRLIRIGSFAAPTYAAGAPGDRSRLFVVEKGGQIAVVVDGHKASRPFLNIASLVNSAASERGLLSIAFAPDYASSGRFYVYYTGTNGDLHIVQYQRSMRDASRADPASARTVLVISHHQAANHNGGQLEFGPDGDLYIGVGDGGHEHDPFGRGQDTDTLLGKLLRISPKPGGGYTIPKGNPFLGRPHRRSEIWAYGLRNPWRFSFDRLTGALVIGDVGQDQQEEFDFAAPGTGAGANYGWSIWEGDRREKAGHAPKAVFPVLVKHHSQGYCAIIGGYLVRDRALGSLYGRYLYGDDCKPQISSVRLSPGHASGDHFTGLSVPELSAFGQDAQGHLYAVSLAGPVYRIALR